MRFYLGTGDPRWLKTAGVPLFISYRAFTQKRPPAAIAPWALDSGGFTELVQYGKWKVAPGAYVGGVRRLIRETRSNGVDTMDFACPQDWICSPPCTEATGKTVRDHQERTVANFVELRETAPDVNWLPILQGWEPQDYFNHVDLYRAWDVDLPSFELVGIGSIALRQDDPIVGRIIRHIAKDGIKLHALGIKKKGLAMYGDVIASSDSMAWSFTARFHQEPGSDSNRRDVVVKKGKRKKVVTFSPMLPACKDELKRKKHDQTCQGCLRWALHWREKVLEMQASMAEKSDHPALIEVDDVFTSGNIGQARNSRAGVRDSAAGDKADEKRKERVEPLRLAVDPEQRSDLAKRLAGDGPDEETRKRWDEVDEGEAGTLFAEVEPTEESTHDRLA